MLSTMQDAPLSIAQLLRHGASVHGASEVVTWTESGPRRVSYADVGKRCAQLAHALRGLGVEGDERVATFMWNNSEHLEAYLAIPSMGAVLHTLNIRLFPEQLIHVANHAEDRVIIVDPSLIPLLSPQLPSLTTVKHIVVTGSSTAGLEAPEGVQVHTYEGLIADQPTEFDWPEVDELSAAAMCYTSGTTGDPKGVVYSHRSIYLHSMQVCMSDGPNLAQGDRALAVVPQFHAMSWGLPYAAFMIGASLIMPDRFLQPAPLAAIIASEKPDVRRSRPHHLAGPAPLPRGRTRRTSPPMREVLIGGSAVPPALMHAFEADHNVSVLHAWGHDRNLPARIRCPPASRRHRRRDVGSTATPRAASRHPSRHVSSTTTAKLLHTTEFPSVSSKCADPGSPGRTTAVDAEDKFNDGWLKTGDVGSITADGFLSLSDRSKDIIKSGGEWISSVDLENAVMGHPDVTEAAVIGVPDEKWDERPLVAVVLRAGSETTMSELQQYLSDKVAKWQLPENWAVVQEVPKTSVGKFDKKRLRADYHEGGLEVTRL